MQGTHQELETLAKEVASAMPDFNCAGQQIAVALYRQLAQGKPVSPEKVAENLDLSTDLVLNSLEGWPGVFYDEEENVDLPPVIVPSATGTSRSRPCA